MRLRMPTATSITSRDGTCVLTYEGLDMAPAQAAGGGMYLLQVSKPEGLVAVRGTVQSVKTLYKAKKQARSEGLDFDSMSLTEERIYCEKYTEVHGRHRTVIMFLYADEIKGGPTRKIDNEAYLSEIFCKLFLQLDSSYQFNNSEYPSCGEGYYPDTIDYHPWDVSPELIRHFVAGEAFDV